MRERPLVIPRAAIFVLVPASAAGTHVHQITPLLQCSLIPATRRQTRPTSKRRNRDWAAESAFPGRDSPDPGA